MCVCVRVLFFTHSIELYSFTQSNGSNYFYILPIFQFRHTVKEFQVLLFNTNNSIQHDSFVCTHLNGSKNRYASLTIQLNITHLFAKLNDQTLHFDTQIGPYQILTLWVRVDLEVMSGHSLRGTLRQRYSRHILQPQPTRPIICLCVGWVLLSVCDSRECRLKTPKNNFQSTNGYVPLLVHFPRFFYHISTLLRIFFNFLKKIFFFFSKNFYPNDDLRLKLLGKNKCHKNIPICLITFANLFQSLSDYIYISSLSSYHASSMNPPSPSRHSSLSSIAFQTAPCVLIELL